MRLSRAEFMRLQQRQNTGAQIPVKNRARVGTGDLSLRKKWYAEMALLPGVFLQIRLYSEANMRDKWATIERTKKHREDVAIFAKAYVSQFMGKKPLVVKLTRYGPRAFDTDNLARAFKSVRDEIAKMVGIDDGDVAAIRFEYDQVKTRVRHYGIRIEISEESKNG